MSKETVKSNLEKPVEETVLYQTPEPSIAEIILNRPERRNAIYPPFMFKEIVRKIEMAVEDDEVKVIVLKGAGTSFCSGEDLNVSPYEAYGGEPGKRPNQRVRVRAATTWMNNIYRSIMYCPKTVICQLKGWTIGVGISMMFSCDLAIASETALLSQRHQRTGFSGLNPGTQMIQFLSLGYKRMREWHLTGRTLTSSEAKDWGLVNAVVPDDKLEEETMRWAKTVALHPGDGLMIAKAQLHVLFDAIGMPTQYEAGALGHPLFTNLRWEGEEFNFLKRRNEIGTRATFAEREARWEQLGW